MTRTIVVVYDWSIDGGLTRYTERWTPGGFAWLTGSHTFEAQCRRVRSQFTGVRIWEEFR